MDKKKKIPPLTRLHFKQKEAWLRLIGILMQRNLLPKADADYILEPLGEEAKASPRGLVYFDEEGKRIA